MRQNVRKFLAAAIPSTKDRNSLGPGVIPSPYPHAGPSPLLSKVLSVLSSMNLVLHFLTLGWRLESEKCWQKAKTEAMVPMMA